MRLGPDVSIIIPCFNQARYLRDAIESVVSQTHHNFEIIVIDDGSTDNTSAVAEQFSSVLCLRQCNQGVSIARNLGISKSTAPYLVFLDADDRLLPEALAAGLAAFETNPECGVVYGRFRRISADGRKLATGWPPRIAADHYKHFLMRNFISPGCVMFRRDAINRVGNFDPVTDAAEDYDLYLRMARVLPVYDHAQMVTERRIHDTQTTKNPVLMLEQTHKVVARQWGYVEHEPVLRDAYLSGLRHYQIWYGEQIVTEAHLLACQDRWQEVSSRLGVLARLYPRGYTSYCNGLRQSNTVTFPVVKTGSQVEKHSSNNTGHDGLLTLTKLAPDHAIVGQPFAPMEDGRSTLEVSCQNASTLTTVIFDEQPLETIVRDKNTVRAFVPYDLLLEVKDHRLYLVK